MPSRIVKGQTLYNAFTRSYELRYIVHAAYRNTTLSVCGRNLQKIATKNKFDPDVEAACKKCLQQINISTRVHPGWS